MIVIAKDLEIRGKEQKTSAKTGNDYIVVRVEDETGKATELLDRNLENFDKYKRGKIADFTLNLDISSKYTNISVRDFTIKTE